MHVLYFSDSYGPHDFRFLSFLVESGCEASFLQRRGGQILESRPVPDRVRLLQPLDPDPGPRRRLGVALVDDLREVLATEEPDLVHAGPVQACAWLVAQAGFRRLVTMSWGSDLLQEARFGVGRFLARGALQRSAAFLGDCDAVRQSAIELGMDESRIVIFPWGVDLDLFRPAAGSETRARLGWGETLVVLCTRSWEPLYGVEMVLDAFLRAARREPRLRLILAGDGSLRPSVVDRIEASGLADRIWLPGYMTHGDLPLLYQAADVYLSGSLSDGSSVSLLEAMACGLASFVSDIPGNREWVEPGVSGRWFTPGDVDGLEGLLLRAPEMGAELRAYGQRAREIAEARADWSRNAPRIWQAYALALDSEKVFR